MEITVIVLVILAVLILVFRRFSKFVYYIAIVDIFLRILDFIANNLPIKIISNILNKYFPNSVSHIVELYTSGIFTTVLLWAVVIIYIFFLTYVFKTFLKKK